LDDDLLAGLELDDVFHGNDGLEDPVLHLARRDHVGEVALHLVLVARVRVHDVPPAGPVVGTLADAAAAVVLVLVLVHLARCVAVGRGVEHHTSSSGRLGASTSSTSLRMSSEF